ncbi:hypothetical protein KOI35_09120 [Actinoplanes bogorensis]|uniref:Uncharacterized protein n=1 Tax=Paractinoplanes bogorensis TaxID=1610840 RepID=A0ABS5YKU2_9ACTN|nr:hypothetical protein [Actinoplanes bogorensis]MBU2663666.1 hypothetical protein [Actinoplanes bogorensis]
MTTTGRDDTPANKNETPLNETDALAAERGTPGEDALKIATIVNVTRNALIGIVAVALTGYFAFKVERAAGSVTIVSALALAALLFAGFHL